MSGGSGGDLQGAPHHPHLSAAAAAAHAQTAAAAYTFWLHTLTVCCIPVALALVVAASVKHAMSTKKNKSTATCKTDTPKRPKKVRSVSVCVDLDRYSDHSQKYHNYYTRSAHGGEDHRLRTISASVTAKEYEYSKKRCDFPFEDLPPDCQLKIFQCLTPMMRGVAAQVCTQWSTLIKSSSLWSTVDFTQFPLCTDKHDCGKPCYIQYRARIKQFISYLQIVRPGVKRLRFAFDIDDHEDAWLESIETFLKAARLQELEFVHLNWAETPVKPYWGNANITWTASDYNALKFKNRHRQRLFVNFFDKFTAAARNIRTLILPFDWSPRSLQALGRLKELHTLVLGKYFENQQLSQDQVNTLLATVPQCKKLILEVWTPSGKGLNLYSIKSPTLPYLDITQCRGFYLQELDLPSVTVFKVGPCHPLKGSLAFHVDNVNVPCIYQLLLAGAPQLRQLNEHTLLRQWRWQVYPELQMLLEAVCPCRQHKKDL